MLIFPYSRNNIIRYSGDYCIVVFVVSVKKKPSMQFFQLLHIRFVLFVVRINSWNG